MILKCKCGNDLQLSEVLNTSEEMKEEIYNCPNLDCVGSVIVKGDILIKSGI